MLSSKGLENLLQQAEEAFPFLNYFLLRIGCFLIKQQLNKLGLLSSALICFVQPQEKRWAHKNL